MVFRRYLTCPPARTRGVVESWCEAKLMLAGAATVVCGAWNRMRAHGLAMRLTGPLSRVPGAGAAYLDVWVRQDFSRLQAQRAA